MAGVYETYDGVVLTLLDEREQTCVDPAHTEGTEIPALADGPHTGAGPSGRRSRIALHANRQRKP